MGDEFGGSSRFVRIMQPTYKVTADENELFDREIVVRKLQPIVDKCLKGEKWDTDADANKTIIHGMMEDLMVASEPRMA